MLDFNITRKENKLVTSLFRKKTHTDLYLNFSSHHPLQHKMGVICTLTHRANTIITEQEEELKEISHIEKALQVCGYQKMGI